MLFITGATGFLGTQLLVDLLIDRQEQLIVLVRATNSEFAINKIRRALTPFFNQDDLNFFFKNKLQIYVGDLSLPQFGLNFNDWQFLIDHITSIIHAAAAVNRNNWKVCYHDNVLATKNLIGLVKEIETKRKLDKFTFISTTTVAPIIKNTCYSEELPNESNEDTHDSYVKSKIKAELLIYKQLPDTKKIIVRPSLIVGNSITKETSQYYVLKFFHELSRWPILPVKSTWVIDTIPVDYVSEAVIQLHFKSEVKHLIYHASSSFDSISYKDLHRICSNNRKALFFPFLGVMINSLFKILTLLPKQWPLVRLAKLWIVFYPYMISSMRYENERIVKEIGFKPVPLINYLKLQMDRAISKKFTNQ